MTLSEPDESAQQEVVQIWPCRTASNNAFIRN